MTAFPSGPRASRRAVAALAAAALLGGAVACEIPTELPSWNTTWEIPADSTTLRVDSLLPGRVTVAGDRSAFLFAVDPVSVQHSLGEVCGSCGAAQGQTVPKPAFTLTALDVTALPAEVESATIADGRITIAVANGFGFDPLRPGAGAFGSMTLEVSSAGREVARLVLDGATTAFGPGTTLSRELPLAPGTIADSIRVRVTMVSPAGDAVRIDTAQRVSVDATVNELRVSSASVRVDAQHVAFEPVSLDLEDIDEAMIDRVAGGELVLDVVNPFSVGGDFTATLAAPGRAVVKTLAIAPGASSVRLTFTAEELRDLLGRSPLTLDASGIVSATAGAVTLAPEQALHVASRLRLTLSSTEQR